MVDEKLDIYKDVYNYLEPITHHPTMTGKYCEMLKIAIKTLEKQIPKKPYDIASYYYTGEKNGTCSICRGHVQGSEKYCPYCGQKLDWD